jgi:(hydroxyamino)benzene mutase
VSSTAPDHPNGQGLLQTGVLLFLLALLVGIAIPRFTLPRLALSVHLLGIAQGTLLIAVGAAWSRFALTRAMSRAAYVLGIYGCGAAWIANLLGAVWGAGSAMVPIAAGAATGTAAQELVIKILLRSAALSLIAFASLLLWGLMTARRS